MNAPEASSRVATRAAFLGTDSAPTAWRENPLREILGPAKFVVWPPFFGLSLNVIKLLFLLVARYPDCPALISEK
jgi:hypothetical protein